jgi:hypothetical protein
MIRTYGETHYNLICIGGIHWDYLVLNILYKPTEKGTLVFYSVIEEKCKGVRLSTSRFRMRHD